MKHPKLWDGISIVLVLFGLGLYGSSCWYGIWALIYVALGCVVLGVLIAVFTQRCPFCHRYLGMMFFTGKKTYCPHCGSDNTYLVTGNELRIKDIAVVDKK